MSSNPGPPNPGPERPIRIVAADDEPLARRTLASLLANDSQAELVALCTNGAEAVAAVREHDPDLLLLDVQMPGMDGFDVLEELGEDAAPRVVFVTAHDAYALRAFEVHAIDYLLKPFDDERFARALERARSDLAKEAGSGMGLALADLLVERAAERDGRAAALQSGAHDGDASDAAPSAGSAGGPAERISIHREGKIDVVDVAELVWVEAADQYVRLHTRTAEHLMRESMARLERQLDPERFLRVHRSAIVALDCIRAFESTGAGCGRVRLDDGTWVSVSRARGSAVRARLR